MAKKPAKPAKAKAKAAPPSEPKVEVAPEVANEETQLRNRNFGF